MKRIALFIALLISMIQANAQGMPVVDWTKAMPGLCESVTTDKWGNIIATGIYTGTQDFDPGPGIFNLTSNGQSDVFITKLDSNGNFLWAKSLGGSSLDTVFNIQVDTFGNIITVGSMNSSGDFDPGPSVYVMGSSSKQVFISKLDMSGNFVWARTFNNTNSYYDEQNGAIALDKEANIYLFGWYHDSVDFDPGPNTHFIDGMNAGSLYLLKLNNNGEFVWVQNFLNDTTIFVNYTVKDYSVTVDLSGNVLVTGATEDYLSIDSINGVNQIFIVKFNSSGVYQWGSILQVSSVGAFPLNSVITDRIGNAFIVINSIHYIDLPDGSELYNSPFNCQLAFIKYDSMGNFIWGKQVVDINPYSNMCLRNINCVAVDSFDNLIISGVFSTTVDFDMGIGVHNLTSNSFNPTIEAPFLYKIDSAGNYKWVYTTNTGFYNSIALDKNGKIIVVGADGNGNIIKYHDDLCATLNIITDSIHSVFCGNPAYIKVSAHNGTSPYYYLWSNSQTIPVISPSAGGIYTVVVHDSIGCVDSESYFINSPTFPAGFDMNTNFVNTGSLQTWTNSPIAIDAFNDGCMLQTGTVKIVLDSLLPYYSAYPTPSQILGDTVVWNFPSMNFNSPHFTPHVTINPMGNIGDTVCVTAIIDPITGDANPTNNVKTSCYVIIGSWDPNDITVFPQGVCDSGYVLPNTTFTYTIDFQNTGNAPASNVYLLDSLDANLDINSVEVVGSSHNMYTEVLAGNVLKFHFDNINLIDQNTNDSASHGYVIYQAKPKSTIAMGSLIINHADIYFDNNPPIITNEVFNKVATTFPCVTGIPTIENISFKISPNPANDFLNIQTKEEGQLQIQDMMGKVVLSQAINNGKTTLNVSSLAGGVYVYHFKTENNQTASGKLVLMK